MGIARRIALVLGLLVAVAPTLAEAGRRPFIWAYDTEIVPEGDVELEQWLWARGRAPAAPNVPARYWIWWSPVIGLSSNLELAFPFQLFGGSGQGAGIDSFEVDLRYRLLPRESQSRFQPLIRLDYHQGIGSPSRVDANLVGSYDFGQGLHATLDLGGRLALPVLSGQLTAPATLVGSYDLGLAYALPGSELKIAAELFGEVGLMNASFQHHFVGPSVSWSRGRLWLTAGTLVGLTPLFPQTPQFMPRLICGIAL